MPKTPSANCRCSLVEIEECMQRPAPYSSFEPHRRQQEKITMRRERGKIAVEPAPTDLPATPLIKMQVLTRHYPGYSVRVV